MVTPLFVIKLWRFFLSFDTQILSLAVQEMWRHAAALVGIRATAFERTLVRVARMNAIEEGHQMGTAGVQARARRSGLQRKAHLHVRRGKFLAREPGSRRKLGLHVIQMPLQLRADERSLNLLGDAACNGTDGPRCRCIRDPVEYQFEQ